MIDGRIDWNALNEGEKAKVAIQIYSPAITRQIMASRDLHAKVQVTVDHRSAAIDTKLADIIRYLWTNGIETTECCENKQGHRMDETESAWISFLSDEFGGTHFQELLTGLEIPFSVTRKTVSLGQ